MWHNVLKKIALSLLPTNPLKLSSVQPAPTIYLFRFNDREGIDRFLMQVAQCPLTDMSLILWEKLVLFKESVPDAIV